MHTQKIYAVKVESWGRSVRGSHTVTAPTGIVEISYKNLRLRRRGDGCAPTTHHAEGGRGFLPRSEGRGSHPEKRMTTTSGPSARSGPSEPPPEATDPRDDEEETVADDDASGLCDQAQDLAANGHLERAVELYRKAAAANPRPRVQARALLGLAVVLDRRGDLEAAREAARRALATEDPRFAPRAAHHLALSLEQNGELPEAERVWRQLLDLGEPAHRAVAHYGLARGAEERGEQGSAEEHWEAVLTLPTEQEPLDDLHAVTVTEAARDLAGRLLERGLPGAAVVVAERGLAVSDQPALRLMRAAARLEQAIADTEAIVTSAQEEPAPPDAGAFAAAVELLAGLLAMRGEPDVSARVWQTGLGSQDPEAAEQIRHRLRRGFAAPPDEVEEDSPRPWWEPCLEEATATASASALADELFAVITRMHNLLAVPLVENEARPAALRQVMEEALRTPSGLVWGPDVHADFRRRLGEAMGGKDVLPEGWPEHKD